MKPVDQTRFGGPDAAPDERGDCWSACIASLLEVPMAEVPHFIRHDTMDEINEEVRVWMLARGFLLLTLKPDGWEPPDGAFAIAAGAGPRGHRHCVVWQGGRGMAHDPHPSRAGLAGPPDEFDLFFVPDPADIALRADLMAARADLVAAQEWARGEFERREARAHTDAVIGTWDTVMASKRRDLAAIEARIAAARGHLFALAEEMAQKGIVTSLGLGPAIVALLGPTGAPGDA